MTREKLIEQAAHDYINSGAVQAGNEMLAFGDFINGCHWADEHPNLYSVTRKAVERERKYLIKRATEWLMAHVTEEKYHPERGFWNIGRFLDDFKKYMEEQQ